MTGNQRALALAVKLNQYMRFMGHVCPKCYSNPAYRHHHHCSQGRSSDNYCRCCADCYFKCQRGGPW